MPSHLKNAAVGIVTAMLMAGCASMANRTVERSSTVTAQNLNGATGRLFRADLEQRSFQLLLERPVDPDARGGASLHTVHWTEGIHIVQVQRQATFEGLSGTYRAQVYLHKEDQVELAAAGKPFWFRHATLFAPSDDESGLEQDERNILLTLTVPEGDGPKRDVTGTINEADLALRLGGGNRSSVDLRKEVDASVLADGKWITKLHGSPDEAGTFVVEWMELWPDVDPRESDDPLVLLAKLNVPPTPKNLRVVWTESPQTQAVVLWDSVGEGSGQLLIRERRLFRRTRRLDSIVRRYGGGKGGQLSNCYAVPLKGLKPSTRYDVTAQIGEKKSSTHYFITAPNKDVDIKLFYAGDSRTNLDEARAVSRMIKETFETDPSYIALLHGGDYANGGAIHWWDPWLAAYYLTTAEDGRLLPIIPTRGNHEGRDNYMFDAAYCNPGQAIKNYYTCALSPEVSILILNSMYSFDEQTLYIESTLSELKKAATRYQVVSYHTPLYPAIKGPHAAKSAWVPLFEKYNIDLGLEADGHCIKRTVPIRNDKISDDGVVYLGEGGYGAPQRTYAGGRWYLDSPGYVSKGSHFMSLSFTKDRIDYLTKQLSKGVVDSASFPARMR